MFLFLLNHFTDALTAAVTAAEQAVQASPDAYALAGVALAVTGTSEAQVYQSVPQMNPRTVRRVLSGCKDSVRMCMSSFNLQGEQVHKDTIESAVLIEVQQAAEGAKVRPQIAIAAVTRYLNSPERVCRVLGDIHSMLNAGCRVWNPTGLFTRLMRNGEEVRLPERVQQQRQQVAAQQEEQVAKPIPQVGMLVKWCGEVCRIIGLTAQFAEVENSDGCVMNVSRTGLRLVPL